MAAQGLPHVWNNWGIQILVLLSFTLQVMLLALAGIRRRNSSAVLRLLLWLMYLLADSTAIYTLGHLSVASNGDHLVAFWAPFLLVHLGGPANITAYALEDNRLWLRHLLTLSVQVLGAAFVIYKYIAGGRALLLLAAVLVFTVGVLRYGERTWALWNANTGRIRSTMRYPQGENSFNLSHWSKLRWPFPSENQGYSFGNEEILLGAHSLFHICKSLFVDATVYISEYNMCCTRWYAGKDVYGLVEMQLSLMYDILYTKAAVVHTWYGYIINVVSPLMTAAALLLFHWSAESINDGSSSKVNVGVSYALLSGTLALETVSVARGIGSTWACAYMYCRGWRRLLVAVVFLRRCIGAATKRRWSGTMGQYNLLHLSTRDRAELGAKLALRLGLESWWKKVHYSGTTAISTTDLKERLLEVFPHIDAKNSRGVHALDSMGVDQASASYTHWTLGENVNFDDSILFWHIATDVYLSESKQVRHEERLVVAVQVLSNYMMFLLMVQPQMLPGPIRLGQCVDTCDQVDQLWDYCCTQNQNQGGPVSRRPQNWVTMLKKLFQGDQPTAPSTSRIQQREELAKKLYSTNVNIATREWRDPATRIKPLSSRTELSAYIQGPLLAAELLHFESESGKPMLEVIFRVWVEMLCYAAHHCSRDSHASQLNNGGEFITVVWLWTRFQQWNR